jgi:hypothetical protein
MDAEVRTTARERGLPAPIADRYRAWIFVFVAWCFEAPPGRIHRDRIGDFWTALVQRPVGRWKVCEAMDALGFLFGTLGGPEQLAVPTGAETPEAGAPTGVVDLDPADGTGTIESVGAEGLDLSLTRPNPKLEAFEADPSTARSEDGEASPDWSQYLPEGPLPKGANARAAIPTREERDEEEPAREAAEEGPPASSGTERTGPDSSRRDGAPTLFNPEGTPLPAEEDPPEQDRSGEGDGPASCDEGRNGSAPPSSSLPGHCRLQDAEGTDASMDDADELRGLPFDVDAVEETGSDDAEETVPIRIPRALADRVRRAAHRLGLPPGIFSARALDLICNDIGVDRSAQDRPHSTLAHYQAQLDLLHLGERVGFDEEGEADRPATTTDTSAVPRDASGAAPAAGPVPNGHGRSEADGRPTE